MNTNSEFKVQRLTTSDTLADRVCDALTELVSGADYHPGARLPSEQEMASRFGVSRTVIREAVSRLKSEGLVESRQGSGVYVRDRNMDAPFRIDPNAMDSLQAVLQVVELRMVLEGEIAFLAAQRRTKKQMTAIAGWLRQIEADERAGKDGVEPDIAFHRSVAEASGNPHFLALVEFLFNCLHGATRITRGNEATKSALVQQVKEEHQAIVDAILRQDPEAARMAARQHMTGAARRLSNANIEDFLANIGKQKPVSA